MESLTPREQEVLDHLAHGSSNRAIAGLLAISSRTVESHLGSIYGKLGVKGRMQAILWTIGAGHQPVVVAGGLRDTSTGHVRAFTEVGLGGSADDRWPRQLYSDRRSMKGEVTS